MADALAPTPPVAPASKPESISATRLPTSGTLMEGKRGLIMGVANDHSIAWGIARAAASQGAELAFTYQSDSFAKRVAPLAESVGAAALVECDVADTDSLDRAFTVVADAWGGLDFVVHAIAYSDREELKGRYVDTSQANFLNTMNISCYSFTAVAERAAKLMNDGGAMVTLTYHGAQQVMPNYNVMGGTSAIQLESKAAMIHILDTTGFTTIPGQTASILISLIQN